MRRTAPLVVGLAGGLILSGCSFRQVLRLAFGRGVCAVGLHGILAFQHTHPTILILYHGVQLAIPGMASLLQLGQELMGLKRPPTCFRSSSSNIHLCSSFDVLIRAR
eukprot:1147955-Pelagomonas_calceolata.AAC.2